MGATAEQYLRQLDAGRRPDLPETTAGTLRLDVRDDGSTDHWYLTIADQQVRVARSTEDADLVVRLTGGSSTEWSTASCIPARACCATS